MKNFMKAKPRNCTIYWVAFREGKVVGYDKSQCNLSKWLHDKEETFFVRTRDEEKLRDTTNYEGRISDPYLIPSKRAVPKKRWRTGKKNSVTKVIEASRFQTALDEECDNIIQRVEDRQEFIRQAIKEKDQRVVGHRFVLHRNEVKRTFILILDKESDEIIKKVDNKRDFIREAIKEKYERWIVRRDEVLSKLVNEC